MMKDHEKRELINSITAAAIKYVGTQQLREQIACLVLPALSCPDSAKHGYLNASKMLNKMLNNQSQNSPK